MSSSQPASTSSSSRMEAFADRLRSVGQRATPQRLQILAAFERPGQHLSADEVFCRVEPDMPSVNRSTVYRTLELYRDLGLISETDLGGGVREYELLGGNRHHHLVCQQCHGTIEFPDELVEGLRSNIWRRFGFQASIDHLAIFGICEHCQDEDCE